MVLPRQSIGLILTFFPASDSSASMGSRMPISAQETTQLSEVNWPPGTGEFASLGLYKECQTAHIDTKLNVSKTSTCLKQ
jgi:hypothetical protein